MSAGLEIAKAGWLHRQSTVLRRWKKNWFVLYRDGVLRFFESQESPRAEEVFILRSCCAQVKIAAEVQVEPPEGVSSAKGCMMELVMRDGANMVLCAESMDDMKAWQYALEEARTMPASDGRQAGYGRQVPITYEYPAYDTHYYGYGGYPGQVISAPPGTQVIHSPDGRTTTIVNQGPGGPPGQQVVYVDDNYYGGPYRRRYRYGAGTGLMAGALIGSSLMWPWYCW